MHHQLARISKTGNDFTKKFDLKDINSQSKLGTFTKSKKRIPSTLVFLAMKIKKNTQYMYQNMLWRKHVDLLLIDEGEKHYVVIKDFNTFMYDNSLHCERKHFWRYCLYAFTSY